MADVAGIVGISVTCGIFGALLAYTRDQRDKALDRVAQLEEERAAREAEAPTRVVKTAMRWNGHRNHATRGSSGSPAVAIIAWVNDNGGEARYFPARIAIRTRDGEAYAKPGDTVVMGLAEFDVERRRSANYVELRKVREFRVTTDV